MIRRVASIVALAALAALAAGPATAAKVVAWSGYAQQSALATGATGADAVPVGPANPLPITVADGANVTLGARADAKSTATDVTPASVVSLLKGQIDRLQAIATALSSPLPTAPPPATATYVQLVLAANTRAQLPAQITGMVNGVVCTAVSANAADVLVGGATVTTIEDGTGNGFPMAAGGSWSEAINTTANTWFISTAASVVACHGN